MKEFKNVCKLRAVGHIDVYQYYDDVKSPCIVTAESDGKVLVEEEFKNEEHFIQTLGELDPYNDINQGENFLNIFYRNQP